MQSSTTQANQSESSEKKGAFYWGWIPKLASESDPVPLESTYYHTFNPFYSIERNTINSDGCKVKLRAVKDENGNNITISVRVIDGLIVFSSEGISTYLADSIYYSVKALFHIDQTHAASQGLHCVDADTRHQAVDKIADEFIDRIIPKRDRRFDRNPETTEEYMLRKGLVEFGDVFVETCGKDMSESRRVMLTELIAANRIFNSDRLDHQNMEVSLKLSEKVRYLTVLVLCLTWFTAVITLMSYLLTSGYIGGDFHTALLLLVAVAPSILWIWLPYIGAKMKGMTELMSFVTLLVHGTFWMLLVALMIHLSGVEHRIGNWSYVLFTILELLPFVTYSVYVRFMSNRYMKKVRELRDLENEMMVGRR